MQRDLAIRALRMAIALRAPPEGCIFHSDRCSQYCSHDYQKILREHGFKASMSGKGNCYDRAMCAIGSSTMARAAVETFFKTSGPSSSGAGHGKRAARLKPRLGIPSDQWQSCPHTNTSTVSITHAVGIQHGEEKAPWPPNAKWPERAIGAAQLRDKNSS